MDNIITSGTSIHGYDWNVTECADTNGSENIYVLSRNQGAHDRRFFIIDFSTSKNEILEKARLFHSNRH